MKKFLKKVLTVFMAFLMVSSVVAESSQTVYAHKRGHSVTRVHKTRHKAKGHNRKARYLRKRKAHKKIRRHAPKRHKRVAHKRRHAQKKHKKLHKKSHKKKAPKKHKKSARKKAPKKHKKATRKKAPKKYKKVAKKSKKKKTPKGKFKLTTASVMAFVPLAVANAGGGASIGTIASLLFTALLAVATAAMILAAFAILVYCVRAYLNSRPISNKEADAQAKKLGYGRVGGLSHGKPVYKSRGKAKPKFISPDQDRHSGGYWKGSNKESDVRSGDRRTGTYDKNLNKKGK